MEEAFNIPIGRIRSYKIQARMRVYLIHFGGFALPIICILLYNAQAIDLFEMNMSAPLSKHTGPVVECSEK
jgi:hypothetical protein